MIVAGDGGICRILIYLIDIEDSISPKDLIWTGLIWSLSLPRKILNWQFWAFVDTAGPQWGWDWKNFCHLAIVWDRKPPLNLWRFTFWIFLLLYEFLGCPYFRAAATRPPTTSFRPSEELGRLRSQTLQEHSQICSRDGAYVRSAAVSGVHVLHMKVAQEEHQWVFFGCRSL